jgi:hypothetical protein
MSSDGLISWLGIREVPSEGTSHFHSDLKTGREQHLFSDYEEVHFLLLERDPSVRWICSQWPILDLPGTLRLSAEREVRHPYHDGFPAPVTVDLLVGASGASGREIVQACAVKTPEDAGDPQVLQALSVQYLWCRGHRLPWWLMNSDSLGDVPTTLQSLRFIRMWDTVGESRPSERAAALFTRAFCAVYERNVLLEDLIYKTARILKMDRDKAIRLFRYASWSVRIPVDVRRPIRLNHPLVLLQ